MKQTNYNQKEDQIPGRQLPAWLQPLAKLTIKALGLSNWKITLRIRDVVTSPSGNEILGWAAHDASYYRGLVLVSEDQSRQEMEETLLHELLHLGVYEIDTAAKRLIAMLPEEDREREYQNYSDSLEQTVERLSRSLRPIFLKVIKE